MPHPTLSCGTLTYRIVHGRPQFLLIKQSCSDDCWGIPKGKMEPNEAYTQTAVRETFEETGITVRIISQLPHVVIQKKNYKKIVVPFLASQTCNKIPDVSHPSCEVHAARWFDSLALPMIHDYQIPIIDAGLMTLEMKNYE